MRYNGRLAVTAFICGLGSVLISTLTSLLVTRMIGVSGIASVSVANSVISMLGRLLLVPLIIAFFKQSKVLNYIAIGIEMMIIILLLAIPGPLMRLFSAGPELYDGGVSYLRMTAVIWFVLAGLCVLFGFVIRGKRMMFCLIIYGAMTLLSAVLVFLMIGVFRMGVTGAAFGNIVQPFHVLLPLLMLNPDRESGTEKPVPACLQE